MITGPLRDRFGLVARLDYYDADELEAIVARAAGILDVQHRRRRARGRSPAARRGTPRIANRLLRRVRDFAEVRGDGTIDADDRPRRAGAVRRRRARARQGRPGHPRRAVPAVRRRPGRAVDAGHQRRRADRDGRGRVRAVPHPAGPARPHAARAGGAAGGLGAPRPHPAGASRSAPRTSSADRRFLRCARLAPSLRSAMRRATPRAPGMLGRTVPASADREVAVEEGHRLRPRGDRGGLVRRTWAPRGCRRRGRPARC